MNKSEEKRVASDTEVEPEATAVERRRATFVRVLTEYLAGPLSIEHSVSLGSTSDKDRRRQHAELWARLRQSTPLVGYPTIEEAEATLRRFLFSNTENSNTENSTEKQ